MMNVEQKRVVDTILDAVENPKNIGHCFYLDGPGGTGKTYTYKTLYYLLKAKGHSVMTMASTGIAAILLPKGQTVHSSFSLDVPLRRDSKSRVNSGTKKALRIMEAKVIIWDEAPMSSRYALENVDEKLRELMGRKVYDEQQKKMVTIPHYLPFGGKIMLLGGDFRQCLPIQPRANRSERIDLSIKRSDLWKYFYTFELTINQRVLEEEKEFQKMLLKVASQLLYINIYLDWK